MTFGYNAVGKTRWPGWESEDWSLTPYNPDFPLFQAGKGHAYWDESMMMLGRILTQITDEDLYQFFKVRITDKIGIGSWEWGVGSRGKFRKYSNT
tara:strand:+ start:14977 stop:15261 length:285 start_codon:yes stop_codon:yes gene_type:complete